MNIERKCAKSIKVFRTRLLERILKQRTLLHPVGSRVPNQEVLSQEFTLLAQFLNRDLLIRISLIQLCRVVFRLFHCLGFACLNSVIRSSSCSFDGLNRFLVRLHDLAIIGDGLLDGVLRHQVSLS